MRAILACSVVLGLSVMGCGGGTTGGASDSGGAVDAAHVDSAVGTDAAMGTDAATGNDSGRDAASSTDAASSADTATDSGGVCHSDSDCPSTSTSQMFCEFPDGMCSGNGTCTEIALVCPGFISTRVCGCDGHTYNNSPCAHSHGTSVRNPSGPCPTSTCGCAADGDCGSTGECVVMGSGGVCEMRVASPMCWRDEDCTDGRTCMGQGVCPCGADCLVADHAGTCG